MVLPRRSSAANACKSDGTTPSSCNSWLRGGQRRAKQSQLNCRGLASIFRSFWRSSCSPAAVGAHLHAHERESKHLIAMLVTGHIATIAQERPR